MPEYMSGRDSGGGAYGKVKCSRCVEEMIKRAGSFSSLIFYMEDMLYHTKL